MIRLPALSLALAALVLAPFPAAAAPLETLEQVEACIRANRPEVSAVQTYELATVDRIGSRRESEGKIYWKKFENGLSKALVRVTGPADVRGTAALILENQEGDPDVYSFLPELGKVRRMSDRSVTGSFMGSDFSYEDLERIQGLSQDAERSLQPPGELDGRPVYVIHGVPGRGKNSEYSRVVTHVDQETCVALRAETYDDKGELEKTFVVRRDQIKKVGDRWIPHALRANDEQQGTHTELEIQNVEIDVDLPDRHFSVTALERSDR
jgi:outer membrane lipoprotein-sorting protein